MADDDKKLKAQKERKSPSLGSGQAEKARRSLRDRGDVVARRVDKATGNGDNRNDD